MLTQKYLPRLLDTVIERYLEAFGAVEIAGTMWSGKTWTAQHHGKSYLTLDDAQARELAILDIGTILKGETPHVVDEWQIVPATWDAVRGSIDSAGGKRGMYILTGSSQPHKEFTRHTGSGRIARLRMWPMSLSESGHSSKTISLSKLFDGQFTGCPVQTNLEDLAYFICRGGWPGALSLSDSAAQLVPLQYLDALFASMDNNAPGSERELRTFMQSLARNIGSVPTLKTIAKDIGLTSNHGDPSDLDTRKISSMIDYFLNRYVICDLYGWDAPIKSPSRLRVKPKRCFADPSLAAALLGAGPQTLLGNTQLFGQLFEELCLRDLRVYTSVLPEAHADSLRYYRDADGLEVDAIIELRDGRWGAIEIKLGANKVDAGARNLLRLRNKIVANPAARNPEPSFMLVLVGKTDFAYQTPEGIIVAPITALTP